MAASAAHPHPESILEWVTGEMEYRPPDRTADDFPLDADSFRKICRGNLAPVWKFLVERVRSEKTVRDIRRNLIVHGQGDRKGRHEGWTGETLDGQWTDKPGETGREEALLQRATAQAEVARLQDQVADLERSLEQQMEDGAREELQRDRDAMERSDQEFRIVALESYQRQMSDAVALFRTCKQRLDVHIAHARTAKQSAAQAAPQQVFERQVAVRDSLALSSTVKRAEVSETPGDYKPTQSSSRSSSTSVSARVPENAGHASTVQSDSTVSVSGKPSSDPNLASGAPLLETATERQVREACEALAGLLEKRIAESVPELRLSDDADLDPTDSDARTNTSDAQTRDTDGAFGSASPRSPGWQEGHSEFDDTGGGSPWGADERDAQATGREEVSERAVTYLGSEVFLGGVIRDVLGDYPPGMLDKLSELLRAPQELLRAVASCTSAAAEALKGETERIDIRGDAERLRYKYENNKIVEDAHSGADFGGARTALALLRERQKAHVAQFMRTEEAYAQADDSQRGTEEAMRAVLEASAKSGTQETILELQVWAQERELAGARAATAVLEAEVARLTAAKEERKRAELLLRRKWQRITEFDARRAALEALHNDLCKENDELAAAWGAVSDRARALSLRTVAPFGRALREVAQRGRDMVAREMEAFVAAPHRTLPPQLAETGTDAHEALTRGTLSEAASGNFAALSALQRARTARHHQSALQSSAATSAGSPMRTRGLAAAGGQSGHTLDKALPRVLQGLAFCHPEYASVAGVISAVAKQLQEAETLSALVSDGRFAVDEASDARPELLNAVEDVAAAAAAQDEEMTSETLTRIRAAVDEARFAIEDSERVGRLIHEWWEQPAFAAVPWVAVDGENAATWLSRVRQLQSALRTKAELNQLERALSLDQK
ncbi:hypothetical protein KFL_001080090 [Klebsormidium nitens]|uniref:Uncharacterized protein n=1 Tax=Klebsormidium nitens TaxID=105231 RepID=A0A1Y1HUN6_KLENI|nr:hypothetical protein KFL_001080090 [Klebsormidium nitens]|eukprot:GAQ82334.1 hypothetical protein KFL_001080090 [Klebsormidium nitens]